MIAFDFNKLEYEYQLLQSTSSPWSPYVNRQLNNFLPQPTVVIVLIRLVWIGARAGDIPGAEDQGKRGDIPEEEDRWQGHRLQGQMGGRQSADKARSPPPGLPNGETVQYINTTTSSSWLTSFRVENQQFKAQKLNTIWLNLR